MNRLLVLLLLVAPLLLQAQRKPKLRGNRKVLEVSERLPAFRAIELKDDLTVNLSRANEESYDMAADENLLDVVNFDVIDGTLVISSFYQITARKKLEIVVYYRELVSLTAEDGELLAHEVPETLQCGSPGLHQILQDRSASAAGAASGSLRASAAPSASVSWLPSGQPPDGGRAVPELPGPSDPSPQVLAAPIEK